MQRITITIEDDLLAEIDAAARARGYQNRSEIIRDLARSGLQQSAADADASGHCVAALVYVYDHAARDLSKRLVQNFHGHHDLSLATLHVHLDDDSCMEVTALKGSSGDVKHLADHVIAERGVRYGRLVMIPLQSQKSSRELLRRRKTVK
jgi:CopG family nickel-responsive transcriptional regulator